MSLSNCTKCGAVFSKNDRPLCPECIREEEERFQIANQWLRDNPGQTIDSLSRETSIGRREILKWVREKRIILAEASDFVRCKKCGKQISTGNFCNRCKLSLSQEMKKGIEAIETANRPRLSSVEKGMHYIPKQQG